jgi:hypothetical protein
MLPVDAVKSLAVNEAAPLVLPSAAAFWMPSVFDENVSGDDTVVDCTPPEALVERSPERMDVIAKPVVVPRPLAKKRFDVEAVVAKKFVEVALPETKRLPVVVAPPAMVSPVVCVPPPMVLDANE